MALPQAFAKAGADGIETGRDGEARRRSGTVLAPPRRQRALERVDHFGGVGLAMTPGEGGQRHGVDPREQADRWTLRRAHLLAHRLARHVYFPSPDRIFCARAISSSPRRRSDSARATARPNAVRR
jgi:hypothetical protein